MTVIHDEDIWTDPSDGYIVRVVRFPYDVETEDGGCIMAFSFHTGELWCERPGQEDRGEQPRAVHIGPLVTTHDSLRETHFERGYSPDTHYLLGRTQGGPPSNRQSISSQSSAGRHEEAVTGIPTRYRGRQDAARCHVNGEKKVERSDVSRGEEVDADMEGWWCVGFGTASHAWGGDQP